MSHFAALSLPDDAARGAALLAAVVLPWLARFRSVRLQRLWPWLLAPACAALLSAGYIGYYLHGGPRIIDATSYWLEARSLASGMFSWPVGEPAQAVLGRFILATPDGGALRAAVIFPPGYPAVLALGFALGAPLAVGPLLAAALVVATAELGRQAARACAPACPQIEALWTSTAASMSVCCAALRYHTADTMSHGLAALCFTATLAAVLRGSQSRRRVSATLALGAGAAAGLLVATRPVSAIALMFTLIATQVLLPAARRWLEPRALLWAAAAATPPLTLWLAYQHAATGGIAQSAQATYYALSDGPPGCFRYGFGAGVGCLGEHGSFVRHNLPHGYGGLAALGTTLRRLKLHLSDAFNFAPLFALVPLAAALSGRWRVLAALTAAPLAQIACYAPFYFDGSYPGGGARMFAEVLPVEQVLGCAGLLALCGPVMWRGRRRLISLRMLCQATICLSLLGFALRTGAQHRQLSEREGGRPMFEPRRIDAGLRPPELLLLDTDHGFNLAFDPGHPATVARYRGDALDLLAWQSRGRPHTYRYHYTVSGPRAGRAWVEPLHFTDPATQPTLRIEAESLWPPAEQRAGWAWPSYPAAGCVSAGRVLAWHPAPTRPGEPGLVRLRLPAALAGRTVVPRLLLGEEAKRSSNNSITLELFADSRLVHRWQAAAQSAPTCVELAPAASPREAHELSLVAHAEGPFGLDMLSFGKNR